MKFCTSCGSPVQPTDAYCHNCGTRQPQTTAQASEVTRQSSAEAIATPRTNQQENSSERNDIRLNGAAQPSRGKKDAALIAAAVIFVALIGTAGAFEVQHWQTVHHQMPQAYQDQSGLTTITFTPCAYREVCEAYVDRQGHPRLTINYQDDPESHLVILGESYSTGPVTGDAWWDELGPYLQQHFDYQLSTGDESFEINGDHFNRK